MKVVIAIDSFKGSMTSMEAGHAAEEGIKRVCPDAEVVIRPLADGGEGTVDALVEGLGGEYVTARVKGPMGSFVTARYGIMDDEKTAIMEMAQAGGIILVDRHDLDTQTKMEYDAFEPGAVDGTDSTAELIHRLESGNKIINRHSRENRI